LGRTTDKELDPPGTAFTVMPVVLNCRRVAVLPAKHLKHHRKMTPIKKPILSFERMGDCDSGYNFGSPASI